MLLVDIVISICLIVNTKFRLTKMNFFIKFVVLFLNHGDGCQGTRLKDSTFNRLHK